MFDFSHVTEDGKIVFRWSDLPRQKYLNLEKFMIASFTNIRSGNPALPFGSGYQCLVFALKITVGLILYCYIWPVIGNRTRIYLNFL